MLLIKNIGLLVSCDNSGLDLGIIKNAAVLIDGALIKWVGREAEIPACQIEQSLDAQGLLVMPGLIDCHSHMIFGGTRELEFSLRMSGQSYKNIMASGGGIMSTVLATAKLSDEELYKLAKNRADKILAQGVTTIEIKSGYGLSKASELRFLHILKKLSLEHKIDIHPTFLGAHVVPTTLRDKPQKYVDELIYEMLPAVRAENLAKDCDVFCEDGAFSFTQAKNILTAAHDLGFGLRAHVQQLGQSGGVKLVAELPILSISHADFLSADDIELLACKNTVVETLPIAALFLRSKMITPVKELIKNKVSLAIATDFNPGSAMCDDLIMAARLAITYFGFNLEQAVLGITKNAASALGLDNIGQIKAGAKADLILTNCHSVEEIFYDWTKHPVSRVIKNGLLLTSY